jgi:glycine cleavage system regulatory protein
MFMSNTNIEEKSKIEFAKRFTAQLKKNRDWEVDIVWANTDSHEETDKISFTVHMHANCRLTLTNEMIEVFGLESKGIDAMECEKILNKQERALVKKIL